MDFDLDENHFQEMMMLTNPCDHLMYEMFPEPTREDCRNQIQEYSPLSTSVEDCLVFDFPGPSPAPSLSHADAPRTATSEADEVKPRRGRKRLPETVWN